MFNMKKKKIVSNFSMKKQLSWLSHEETKQKKFTLKAVYKHFDTSSIKTSKDSTEIYLNMKLKNWACLIGDFIKYYHYF